MATYPMAPVDAAWYHIDGPVNFAMVTGILLTRTPLSFEKVKRVFRHRLARFDRFRQRVVEGGFPVAVPYWEDLPDFDIGQQLHHIGLPEPHDQAALAGLISELASTPLDHDRPLWDAHVVDDVDGGSALILRIHHCIGDGTAAMVICRELFDTTRKAPVARAPERDEAKVVAPGAGLLASAFAAAGQTARRALEAAEATLATAAHPQQLLDQARLAVAGAGTLVSELLKRPDPASPLKGAFGLQKRVAWSEPVALADVKAIGAPLGAKVNDVLVAGMTGALRAYLRKRGFDVNDMTVRAMVPVDLRPPERAQALGNEFGLVILELAIQSRTATTRLQLTKARMDALKRSPEPVAILALFDLFGRVPKVIEDFAVDLFGSKASLVMTNVAGPQQALHLAGVPIERLMFWVPHPGRQLGMGISIMSYNGRATLAVVADAHLVPDPEAITAGFSREFARMLKAVRATTAKPAAVKAAKARLRGRAERA
jgi:diacylglycerol O-acyltransferase / wax synthase